MSHEYVLLGDVVSSARVKDRERLRARLEGMCGALSSGFAPDLVAPFSILKGVDEVGAVLASAASVYEMLLESEEALRPERMRFVLVRGHIDTAAGSGDVSRMDGPAFHSAAKAMEELKKSRLLFDIVGGDDRRDDLLGGLVSAVLELRGGWSEHQRKVATARASVERQADVAARLGVTQQAVSDALRRSSYWQVERLERRIRAALAGME